MIAPLTLAARGVPRVIKNVVAARKWKKKCQAVADWLSQKSSSAGALADQKLSWRKKEGKKITVRTGLSSALWRCKIHVLPIGATIIIAWLNIRGCFVGNLYQGYLGRADQKFYGLLLQITAKFVVGYPLANGEL